MRIQYFSIYTVAVFFSLAFLTSCNEKASQKDQIISTHSDSVWVDFLNAMEKKDTNFLLRYSLDSITCADCKLLNGNDDELYESSFVFKNHLNKIMHLDDLKTRVFQTSENDNELQVIYSVESKSAEEGAYSLIFLFEKKGKDFLFKGMIVT